MKRVVIIYDDGTSICHNRCLNSTPAYYYLTIAENRRRVMCVTEQVYPLMFNPVVYVYKNPHYYGVNL